MQHFPQSRYTSDFSNAISHRAPACPLSKMQNQLRLLSVHYKPHTLAVFLPKNAQDVRHTLQNDAFRRHLGRFCAKTRPRWSGPITNKPLSVHSERGFLWCHRESNQGHKDFQSFALPTELWHQILFRTTLSFDWDCKGRQFFRTCKLFLKN